MTNEIKAKELLGAPTEWTFNYWLDGFSEATQKELREKRNLLIKMAEWKDQEYKERVKKLEALIKEQKEWQEKDCNHSWECQEAYIEGLKDALEFFI